jgi:hypothetical protein
MNIELESQIKRLELIGHLIDEAEITSWAEGNLLASENPSSELCDVVSAKGFEQQEKSLNVLAKEKYENDAFALVCKNLLKQQTIDLHDTAKVFSRIAFYTNKLDSEYTQFCSWLDTEADLISNGYKDLDPAIIELSKFLTKVSGNASNV